MSSTHVKGAGSATRQFVDPVVVRRGRGDDLPDECGQAEAGRYGQRQSLVDAPVFRDHVVETSLYAFGDVVVRYRGER
ncbi:hypothetical protein ACFVHR_28410 [Streptomyces sp. NPDC127168]|uniref:hypothetical protein n=1 Tax=unclassified Streptomyces TaxID=2593676 RepID=UPI003628EFE2